MLDLDNHKNVSTEEIELKKFKLCFLVDNDIKKLQLQLYYTSWEIKEAQIWLVSLKSPQQWQCLKETLKIVCSMEICWKDNEISSSNCRSFSFSTLCTEVFTLINSLPAYDSFSSIPSHCFRILEHWLPSYYFGLQSRLSVLWSVHRFSQVSPLEWKERCYFSRKCTCLKKIVSTLL